MMITLFPTVVYCCEILDGKVVSGGGDGLVKVWKSQSGLLHSTLTGHTQEVVRQSWRVCMLCKYKDVCTIENYVCVLMQQFPPLDILIYIYAFFIIMVGLNTLT